MFFVCLLVCLFLRNPVQLPQLSLDGEVLQVVNDMNLLGLEIQNNLGVGHTRQNMISRASRRLLILYALRKYGAPVEDMLAVFYTYITQVLLRCLISCANQSPITSNRTSKRIYKIILAKDHLSDESAFQTLSITTFEERKKKICS